MPAYTLATTLHLPHDAAVDEVREGLADQGSEALQADPSIATVLPRNVVVRSVDAETTVVEAFDPDAIMGLSDSGGLDTVAADARQRLTALLTALSPTIPADPETAQEL